MQWITSFDIPSHPTPISHNHKILSLGSCFAESIGNKMKELKMDILINPFGTLFHPIPICQLLEFAIHQKSLPEELILERDGMHFHYWTHSQVMGYSKEELRGKLAGELILLKEYLENSDFLIITLGSSWLYELVDSEVPVANCHKQPGKLFSKKLASLEAMQTKMNALFQQLQEINPQLKIILTVSPVRHIKDGVPENQLSKSLLRILCHQLCQNSKQAYYFPSYEIMMDELRDYRFYKSDLIHPTTQAEDYIWRKWKTALFHEDCIKLLEQVSQVNLDLAHRPLNPKSESHRKFLSNLLQKLERLNGVFDFSKEIGKVKTQLKT
ncbi:GSCFA domain-containing protein [Algoriphagus aestuarii]|nr:GSCFA domain-containing protein [Algoriphagus aestuarii]